VLIVGVAEVTVTGSAATPLATLTLLPFPL